MSTNWTLLLLCFLLTGPGWAPAGSTFDVFDAVNSKSKKLLPESSRSKKSSSSKFRRSRRAIERISTHSDYPPPLWVGPNRDPRNLLLVTERNRYFHDHDNRDDLRKGLSYLPVPDFHRRPLYTVGTGKDLKKNPPPNNRSIDDIISGIIQLLGGDVPTRPQKPTQLLPSRINNRGPQHFDSLPSRVEPSTAQSSHSTSNSRYFPLVSDVSHILGLLNSSSQSNSHDSSLQPSFSEPEHSLKATETNLLVSETTNQEISSKVKITSLVIENFNTAQEFSHAHSTIENETLPTVNIIVFEDSKIADDVSTERTFTEILSDFELDHTTPQLPPLEPFLEDYKIPHEELHPSLTDLSEDATVPTGPVTAWFPVFVPQILRQKPNATRTKINDTHISIITEPSVYQITVQNSVGDIGDNKNTGISPTTTLTGTYTNITPKSSQSQNLGPTIHPTIKATDSSHLKDPHLNPDIIYGRPTDDNLNPPSFAKPTVGLRTSTLPFAIVADNKTRGPSNSQLYGHVVPVDIEKVRPASGSSIVPSRVQGSSGRPVQIGNNRNQFGHEIPARPSPKWPNQRQQPFRPPAEQPLVRIDTCVVGDDSTCEVALNEHCRTEQGVSACFCRPGFSRNTARGPCIPVISFLLVIHADQLGSKKITQVTPNTPEYQRLHYEASQALNSLFLHTAFATEFIEAKVNGINLQSNRLVINGTIHIGDTEVTRSQGFSDQLKREVSNSVSRKDNRLGDSNLFVDDQYQTFITVDDFDECSGSKYNDCSVHGECENTHGSFVCTCQQGYMDKFSEDRWKSGRVCSVCHPDYCSNHGTCIVTNGHQECRCRGNYIGAYCQIDSEVVGVATGVSVVATVIIILTIICLCLWNKRWKKTQQKTDAAKAAGLRLATLVDHVRWSSPSPTNNSTSYHTADAVSLQQTTGIQSSHIYSSPYGSPVPHYRDDSDENPYGRINRLHHGTDSSCDTLHFSQDYATLETYGFSPLTNKQFISRPLYR